MSEKPQKISHSIHVHLNEDALIAFVLVAFLGMITLISIFGK